MQFKLHSQSFNKTSLSQASSSPRFGMGLFDAHSNFSWYQSQQTAVEDIASDTAKAVNNN
jgi:hypothetical protein